jgi:hypothetical protein
LNMDMDMGIRAAARVKHRPLSIDAPPRMPAPAARHNPG